MTMAQIKSKLHGLRLSEGMRELQEVLTKLRASLQSMKGKTETNDPQQGQ